LGLTSEYVKGCQIQVITLSVRSGRSAQIETAVIKTAIFLSSLRQGIGYFVLFISGLGGVFATLGSRYALNALKPPLRI